MSGAFNDGLYCSLCVLVLFMSRLLWSLWDHLRRREALQWLVRGHMDLTEEGRESFEKALLSVVFAVANSLHCLGHYPLSVESQSLRVPAWIRGLSGRFDPALQFVLIVCQDQWCLNRQMGESPKNRRGSVGVHPHLRFTCSSLGDARLLSVVLLAYGSVTWLCKIASQMLMSLQLMCIVDAAGRLGVQ